MSVGIAGMMMMMMMMIMIHENLAEKPALELHFS
jgi:hypothetical protein